MTRARILSAVALALAATVVGALVARPGSGRAAAGGPLNTAPPTIWGAAQEGQTLTASTGSWSGSPTSYAYAWSRCDTSGASCAAIAGATSATYAPVAADVGHTLRVVVTAATSGGTAQATSPPSAVISSTAAPTSTAAPSISGSFQVGSTLTASQGSWSGNPTSYAYAWSRCDATGDSCARIDGATSATYTLTDADAGAALRISVTATNASGSTVVTSAASTPLPAANGCPPGTGTIQIADLTPPARLSIDKAWLAPHLVTLSTQLIQLHVLVTACNGRPVQGASVYATPIPFNQFAGVEATTGPDGTVTLSEQRLRGFPARSRHQQLLAVFVRARKPGEPVLAGVSTRRTVAFPISLP